MSRFKERLNGLYNYRNLLQQLVERDVKLKYRRSFLGYLWSILNPLMIMMIMVIVFSNMFRFAIQHYPVYLIIGQTVFKSLNKKKQAIFFSLLRKVFIVVPLTYLFPYTFRMGTRGVFLAEPISNVIGGSLCFITMLAIVMPELKKMEEKNYE